MLQDPPKPLQDASCTVMQAVAGLWVAAASAASTGVSCVQRCPSRKFCLPVALKEPVFCGIVEPRYTFLII